MRYAGILCVFLVLFSCEHPLEPTQPTIISVAVSPSSAQVLVSENLQFNVSVEGTGDFDSMVAWYVNGMAGGGTEYGTINPEGLYTAPETVPIGAQAIVQVVSITDITKLDSAIVTIYSNINSVTITPQPDSIFVGYEKQFTAMVHGNGEVPTDVVWYVNGVEGGIEKYGFIDQYGYYTAPDTVPLLLNEPRIPDPNYQYGWIWRQDTVVVTAASTTDPQKQASAQFFIYSGIQAMGIKPIINWVVKNDTIQFNPVFYVFYGDPVNTSVRWFIGDGLPGHPYIEGGNEELGTISKDGFYKAPAVWPPPPVYGACVAVISAVDYNRRSGYCFAFN